MSPKPCVENRVSIYLFCMPSFYTFPLFDILINTFTFFQYSTKALSITAPISFHTEIQFSVPAIKAPGTISPKGLFFNLTFAARTPNVHFCSLDQKCVRPAVQQSHAHQKRQHQPDRQLKAVANQKSAALTSACGAIERRVP